MGIFGGDNQPERLFGTKVNESKYGMPFNVVMGTGQVAQAILWVDGFDANPAPTGKGTSGGGKGGSKNSEFLYSADVVVALCCGPILGIGDVWSGQTWLGSPQASESYTISSGTSYQYTPANATTLLNDLGVGAVNTYSSSNNDLGAPSPTVLSGTFLASMKFVAWGSGQTPSTLTTGQYSINPTGNAYIFSSADVGRTATISYSYSVEYINRQENDIVPSGRTIVITGDQYSGTEAASYVSADLGVIYTTTSVAFIKVTGTPTVAGTYSTSGNNPCTYSFATADINALVTISYAVYDPNIITPGQATSLNYTLQVGLPGQSPYAFLTASFPGAAFGYTSIATLLYQPMDLGLSAEIQENRFEVITADVVGGGIQDCNPVQCIGQVLTNSQWGLGVGSIPFPVAVLDNGASGTWGSAPGVPGASSTNNTAYNWFAAQSFFISPVLDSQDTASSTISKWLEAGMCAAYFSEGLLKLVPYGDTSAAGNGATWTAPTEYIVELDDTCFVSDKEGADPVKVGRTSAHDAWNICQISWGNRLNEYAPEVTQESDQGLINRWGERREDPQSWDFIHTVTAATFAANMRIKHNAYTRNTYDFTLPYSYSYLEPMDIVTLTTSSVWAAGLNNVNLGVVDLPVRVNKIVDDPKKGLAITCEDYPFGSHQPTIYNKQLNESEQPISAYADPGQSVVVMFEATSRLTLYDGDQIWIGALGTGDNWGSTNIWVSQTIGGDYSQVGTIKTPARLGALNATFPSGSDPDTVNSLVVNLENNSPIFEAGTTSNADNAVTMCFVDGEIISYSAVTYTGQSQVTMGTYIRRGQMGTTISSHPSGGLFLRLDPAVFKYTYDPTWRGQTLYFKFQSVNSFGLMAQDLSTLTPIAFTLPGVNPGSIDAATGLVFEEALGTNASYRPLSNPLTSIDDGSSTEVDIASFNMQVAGDTIHYSSGSVTSLLYSTLYYVYFDDPLLAGGTVTFNVTTTKATAMSGATRYFVGSIVTPVSGGVPTIGNNDGGTGAQSGTLQNFTMSISSGTSVLGNGTLTNAANAIDGNSSNCATLTATGNGAGNLVELQVSGPPGVNGPFTSANLVVVAEITSNNLTPGPNSEPCTAGIYYGLSGTGGPASPLALYNPPTTLTKQTLTFPLSLTQNMSQVVGIFTIATRSGSSSFYSAGTVTMNIYNVYIQVTQ